MKQGDKVVFKDIKQYAFKTEKSHQREAFELYYSLGAKRSLRAVANAMNRSERCIQEWSSKFGWRDRVKAYDIEVNNKLKEDTISSIVEDKLNYRKIIKAMVGQVVRDIKEGEFKASTVKDLETLIKLDLTLVGEATELSKVENKHTLSETDIEVVNEVAHVMRLSLYGDNEES